MVFLFEFALGYALFDAHGVNQLPETPNFKIADEFLNKDPFKLIAFYRFASPREALLQMKAILNCKCLYYIVCPFCIMYKINIDDFSF